MIGKVKVDHDVALIDLVEVFQQARHDPVAPTSRDYSVTGAVNDQGFYTCFHWDFLDDADYASVLTQFGLTTEDEADVTVYVRSSRLVATRYNGKAMLPQMGADIKRENFWVRDVALYVVNLTELS